VLALASCRQKEREERYYRDARSYAGKGKIMIHRKTLHHLASIVSRDPGGDGGPFVNVILSPCKKSGGDKRSKTVGNSVSEKDVEPPIVFIQASFSFL